MNLDLRFFTNIWWVSPFEWDTPVVNGQDMNTDIKSRSFDAARRSTAHGPVLSNRRVQFQHIGRGRVTILWVHTQGNQWHTVGAVKKISAC